MAELVTIVLLMVLGFFMANIFVALAGWAEKKTIFGGGAFDNPYALVMGSLYFATVFSIPMSGNIPLFVLVAGLFLYSLYGSFAADKLKPLKPEDKVVTKWFSGHP